MSNRQPFSKTTPLLALALLLSGCSTAVLNPAGPIGGANRVILLDSLAIMLAIVIPTILATLGVRLVVPGFEHQRANVCRTSTYSGRIELIVWSIPLLTILLLGGVDWVGSHDLDPAKPIASPNKADRGPGRLARLEVAVHLSRPGHRSVNSWSCRPARRSISP